MTSSYRNASRRYIFLDYYRTLSKEAESIKLDHEWPMVSVEVLSSLEHLCKVRATLYFSY